MNEPTTQADELEAIRQSSPHIESNTVKEWIISHALIRGGSQVLGPVCDNTRVLEAAPVEAKMVELKESNNALLECIDWIRDVFKHYGEDCSSTPPMSMNDAAKVLLFRIASDRDRYAARVKELEKGKPIISGEATNMEDDLAGYKSELEQVKSELKEMTANRDGAVANFNADREANDVVIKQLRAQLAETEASRDNMRALLAEADEYLKVILTFGGKSPEKDSFGDNVRKALETPPGNALDKVREALSDALSGWKYIRTVHGDLSGVGWDRVEAKLKEAINSITPQ